MLFKNWKRSGISLAQTLLITGIVFLVLFFIVGVPLYKSYKKKRAITKLKITYSELIQANRFYSMANSDTMGVFDTSLPIDKFVDRYFLPYLSVESSCTSTQKACWKDVPYKDLAGNNMNRKIQYTIEIKGQTSIGFSKDDRGLISLIVDLDSMAGENKLGRDVYVFSIYNSRSKKLCEEKAYEGKTIIEDGIHFGGFDKCGIPQDEYDYMELFNKNFEDGCNKKSPKSKDGTGVGSACASLIKESGWVMDKTYPW